MQNEQERQASNQDNVESEIMFEDNQDKLEYYTDFTKAKQNQLIRLHDDEEKLNLFKRWKEDGQAFTRPIFEIIPINEKTNKIIQNPLNINSKRNW